jgi:hypothetical protein
MCQPNRQFRCEEYFLTVSVRQDFFGEVLALVLMITVSGIDIIHALIDSQSYHLCGLNLVDNAYIVVQDWKPHHTEP